MVKEQIQSENQEVNIRYRRKRNKKEMQHQVISFSLMIFLTLVAFFVVGYGDYSGWFVIPFILVLASVQVGFQLYYFMHMSSKGHDAPALFLYSAVLVAFVTILAFITIIWL